MSQKPVASSEGIFDRRFVPAARWLLAKGVHPNHFTFAQVPVFAVQLWAADAQLPWLFVGCIAFVIALDGGDGILARVGGMQSRTGAILDSTFDTLGVAIVMWGAALFFPEFGTWLFGLFLLNGLIYLQNALLNQKMISYIRGPILAAVAWPDFLWGALVVTSFMALWLFVARLPKTFVALGQMD